MRNRNRSNAYNNSTRYNNDNEKESETHNHFYSVRNRYKKLAIKKNNIIKNALTNINVGPTLKDNDYNIKKQNNLNISQNLSPKNGEINYWKGAKVYNKIKYLNIDLEDKDSMTTIKKICFLN